MSEQRDVEPQKLLEWMDKFPMHISVLIIQVLWSEQVEEVLSRGESSAAEQRLGDILASVDRMLGILANCVLEEQPSRTTSPSCARFPWGCG